MPGLKTPFPQQVIDFYNSTLPEYELQCGSHNRICQERDAMSNERSAFVSKCADEFRERFETLMATWPYPSDKGVVVFLKIEDWINVRIIFLHVFHR